VRTRRSLESARQHTGAAKTSAELLVDAFGRIRQVLHRVVTGLTPEQLAFRAV
jgi:hypothetical protein